MLSSVQPQAVVHVLPHPGRPVTPFKHHIHDSTRGKLLRDRQTSGTSADNYGIVVITTHLWLTP